MALLVVAEGIDSLKSHFTHEAPYVAMTQREHIEVIGTPVAEGVAKASEAVRHFFRDIETAAVLVVAAIASPPR